MFEESLVSIWASLNSWLTPTVLLLLLNLMIGTIVFASTQNHHTQPDPHHHQGLMRSASVLQRLKSINFYSNKSQEFDTHLANPHELEDSTKLVRSPSVLQRLQSIKFNFHFPQHDQSPQSDNVHEEHKTDEIELDEVVDQFESRDQQQTLDEVYRKLQTRHVSRTSSDTKPVSGEVVMKLAKKMRKSATVKEKMVSEVEHHEDEEVDAKADDFINRFKQQLKLQRIDSIIRYKDMISNRGNN